MSFDLDELKKNHNTSYLASILERLDREETQVREMMGGDDDLHEMAAAELKSIQEQREITEKQIQNILDKDKEEEEMANEIVLEVRAGAGGDEASLFAWELAHMYELYSTIKGWQWKTNYESKSELGGYKEASFEVKGKDVYKMLRYETGVHRVQRIPATEKNGRVHTSTASVAVLPETVYLLHISKNHNTTDKAVSHSKNMLRAAGYIKIRVLPTYRDAASETVHLK